MQPHGTENEETEIDFLLEFICKGKNFFYGKNVSCSNGSEFTCRSSFACFTFSGRRKGKYCHVIVAYDFPPFWVKVKSFSPMLFSMSLYTCLWIIPRSILLFGARAGKKFPHKLILISLYDEAFIKLCCFYKLGESFSISTWLMDLATTRLALFLIPALSWLVKVVEHWDRNIIKLWKACTASR